MGGRTYSRSLREKGLSRENVIPPRNALCCGYLNHQAKTPVASIYLFTGNKNITFPWLLTGHNFLSACTPGSRCIFSSPCSMSRNPAESLRVPGMRNTTEYSHHVRCQTHMSHNTGNNNQPEDTLFKSCEGARTRVVT